MRHDLKVTAVIPTYNRDQFVGRAIESALAQQSAPSEIIVVDDGSADQTRSVVASYGARVRYLYQPNCGVSAARNRGVREAQSDWIAFLDSDDTWVPEHLHRMMRAIVATDGAAALYFADLKTPESEGGQRYWSVCGFEPKGEWEYKHDAGEWALMPTQPMMIQASVISRQRYWEVGGLPEQLRTREDTLLFFKLGFSYPACSVAGCGTIQHCADSIRLTRMYNERSLMYGSATVSVYKELVSSLNGIAAGRRQFLIRRLGSSYYALGRLLARQSDFVGAFKYLVSSCWVSPSTFVNEAFGTLGRCLSGYRSS